MKDLISIVVLVYNTSKYLNRCLDSILNQSYKNIEIILIDDGSTDDSKQICIDYVNKDSRIKYFRKKNGGASCARNFGIRKATGKYIGFVDSDDVIHKDMFLILYNNMIKEKADMSICEVTKFNEKPNFTVNDKIEIYSNIDVLKIILEDKKICSFSVNKLYKLENIKDIKYPIGKVQEDVGTIYKFILKSPKIVYTSSELYGYFKREDSITNTINIKFVYDYFSMIEKRKEDLKDMNITKYLDLNYANVILGICIDLSLNIDLLMDKEFDEFIRKKIKELKLLHKKTKSINTKKHNILINILLLNRNIFFVLMRKYLKLKRQYHEKNIKY